MATIHEITASSRADEGKGASRRLRRAGQVPGVVYGGDQDPQSIQIEHNSVLLAAKNEWFFSSVLDLNVDGKTQKVLVRDWQKHPFKLQMLHLDFLRINENEKIRVSVPVHYLNQETSPAGKISSVVISHHVTEVEIACLPKDLPEHLEVDLGKLEEGDIVHLSDIVLPAGVEIPELKLGKEHDHTMVTAHTVREEVEPAPEGEAAAAEPAPAAAAAPAAPKEEQ
ncbi:MAG TPA: 50S ribosomal protein L25/general stress protein Ctc [Rhodanobacteraceae bacterium]|jgi:large subunit ribosomal protein L25|nr:50S ribosomal protein L25/general stress protein Ctc [Rhodanobacteraceae bacterium]